MSFFGLQQAVVDELNNHTFSMTGFDAKKSYVPETTLEELEDLKIFVLPGDTVKLGRLNRDTLSDILKVEIGVVQRLRDGVTIEDLLSFVNEVGRHFFEKDLPGYRAADENVEIMPYDYDQLNQNNTVLSLITLTYKETS